MRLATINDPIQSAGLGTGNTFTIAASAKAFDILSSNLYQNKILAVIREISCNAADAHTTLGKSLDSINIHLPTYSEPYFSVRDFGPGLSEADILHLYTTYFMSTKDATNDLIGGFGLGSKSPFSLVDQFVVTSWHGGVRSEYVMYKDAGTPKVNVIRHTPNNSEPSGILVQVAVDKNYSTWVTEAQNFFRWWPVRPNINATIPESMFSRPGAKSDDLVNNIPIWKYDSGLQTSVAFVGLVSYPINFGSIPNFDAHSLPKGNFILTFNVGDVDVAPSRETLSYDPKTCANIISHLENIKKQFTSRVSDEINKQKTLYDARCLLYGTYSELNRAFRGHTFTWNGTPVPAQTILIPKPKDTTWVAIEQSWRGNIWRRSRHLKSEPNSDAFIRSSIHTQNTAGRNSDVVFVWSEDTLPKTTNKICSHLNNGTAPLKLNRYNSVYVVAGRSFAEFSSIFEAAGYPPLFDLTTWPDPPKAPRAPRSVTKTTGYQYKPNSFESSPVESDLNIVNGKGGLCIPFFDGNPQYPTSVLRHANNYKLIDSLPELVGIKKTHLDTKKYQNLLAANNWVIYDEDWFANTIDPNKLYPYAAQEKFLNHFSNSSSRIIGMWKLINNTKHVLKDPFLVGLHALLNATSQFAIFNMFLNIKLSDKQTKIIEQGHADGDSLYADYLTFMQKNPMLEFIDWSYNLKLDSATFFEYINR